MAILAHRRYRTTQSLATLSGTKAPAGSLCEILAVDAAGLHADIRVALPDGTTAKVPSVPENRLKLTVGKPYCPAFGDAPRANFGGKVAPSGAAAPAVITPAAAPSTIAPEAPVSPVSPDVSAAIDALKTALAAAAAPAPAALDTEAVREIAGEEADARIASLRAAVAPLIDLAAKVDTDAPTRARLELATAASANPILDRLMKFYRPGTAAGALVCLLAPPSIGKTYAFRQLGKAYDLYLEHGCTDDVEETNTQLGTITADGRGGWMVVDGVLTQAVRAAAEGQTVLLLLDEVFRMSERTQETLLQFLTGEETPDGKVYRLRTRRTTPDGTYETIVCPASHLHIGAAANLGARTPVEAFWSRWHKVRITFDPATVRAVAKAVASSYSIADVDVLADRFTAALVASRAAVMDGSLKYPLDIRNLQTACTVSPDATASSVCKTLAEFVADHCAHWGVDSGETDPASMPSVAVVRSALGVA